MGIWFFLNQSIDTSKATLSYIDIPYANDSITQKLDIYLPDWQGPFPVFIAIHWGAFKMWSLTATDLASMMKWLESGYVFVTVHYWLSSEKIFPAAIDDIQWAISFIKKSAKIYNINPEKIWLWWDSAWWNLAALAGTKWSVASGTNVQAVVDWFGPIYFSRMDNQFSTLCFTPTMGKTNIVSSTESQYIGKTIGSMEAEPIIKLASPETYISAEDPLFYIQHGTLMQISQSHNQLISQLNSLQWL